MTPERNRRDAGPGLEFEHNSDLSPGEPYLAAMPHMRAAFGYEKTSNLFGYYDGVANAEHRVLRRTGMVSLILGGVALSGIVIKLMVGALGHSMPLSLIALFEAAALGSIVLALGPWFSRTRTKWLTARFMTEQIRQWQFQLLLDGRLLSQAMSNRDAFEAERTQRWARFESQAVSAEGTMNSFADGEVLEFYHDISPYGEPEAAEETLRAYMDLRFHKQLAYFNLKRQELMRRDGWVEALSRWSLFMALVLASGQLLIVAWNWISCCLPHGLDVLLGAAALWLVVCSASVRIYQHAMHLAEQIEHYETKWLGLVILKTQFDAAGSVEEKLGVMRQVEVLEIDELREFLRQMRKTSYLL
ncbi:MAG: hypothetical protein AABO58_09290 [Acidobacteriota bacterium]